MCGLSLHVMSRAYSSSGALVCRLLIEVASLVAEQGSRVLGLQ